MKLAKAISLDVTDDKALDAVVAQHELVISLIPYTFHAAVIKSAIRHKKHVVTTSYVSPAMLELDQQAKDAGITVMNEIGVSHTEVSSVFFMILIFIVSSIPVSTTCTPLTSLSACIRQEERSSLSSLIAAA